MGTLKIYYKRELGFGLGGDVGGSVLRLRNSTGAKILAADDGAGQSSRWAASTDSNHYGNVGISSGQLK